jgi:putative sigma-54 modulation protein
MQPATNNNPTVHITGHNLDLTPALKARIEEKLNRLHSHYPNIIDAQVKLTIEKGDGRIQERKELQKASAHLLLSHGNIAAESAEDNMYASIDLLMDKLDVQLKKHKEIMKEKR